MERDISRRDILKGTALAGAGLAAMGLIGCAPTSKSESDAQTLSATGDISWDEEKDFIVVGAGTGLFGALAAQENGKEVVVLEKGTTYGGTTFLSGGGFWLPLNHMMEEADSVEDTVAYMLACDLYGTADEAICADYAKHCGTAGQYVAETLGAPFMASPVRDYNNYDRWGHRQLSLLDADGAPTGAKAWNDSMRPIVDASGLDIRLSTEVTDLITDENGTVVGVEAQSGSDTVRIKARSGVLLATGGFDHNEEMRHAYLRGPLTGSVAVPTNTGDGHRMGVRVGGKLMNMASVFGTNAFKIDDSGQLSNQPDHYGHRSRPNTIIVNANGRRFFNEGGSYDTSGTALANIECGGKAACLATPATFVADSRFVADYGFGEIPGKAPAEWVRSYNTLEELAEGEGLDKERFLEEIDRFNVFCEQGVDRDFHRGESGFEASPDGLAYMFGVVPRDDLANPFLGPISTAPFYAATYGMGSFGTSGGLQVNEYAQVMGEDGPIGNLYAAGCCAASLVSGYPGPGTAVATGMYRSVRAADHALELGIFD